MPIQHPIGYFGPNRYRDREGFERKISSPGRSARIALACLALGAFIGVLRRSRA